MVDDNKPTDDVKPVDDIVSDEEPKTEDVPAEEPAASPAAPADDSSPSDDSASSAGTDQHGRQLYSVTCSSCGKPAQVPFKPSGDRPVYCRDCYMQQRGGGMNRGGGRY